MADFSAQGEDAAMARFNAVGSGNMPEGVVGAYAKWAKTFDEVRSCMDRQKKTLQFTTTGLKSLRNHTL